MRVPKELLHSVSYVPPPAQSAEEESNPVTTKASEPVPEAPAAWTGGTREFASGIELIESLVKKDGATAAYAALYTDSAEHCNGIKRSATDLGVKRHIIEAHVGRHVDVVKTSDAVVGRARRQTLGHPIISR